MHTLTFTNDGTLDPLMISTMGVSVKEGPNPIGYFGTGLKYAIAVFLRLGCRVEFETGGIIRQFRKRPVVLRGQPFEIVLMGRKQLGFTTQLGKDWELWQAFREFYSNCLDEDGVIALITGDDPLSAITKKQTCFRVTGPHMMDLFRTREEVIMTETPFLTLPGVEIHSGRSEYAFYRGIRAMKIPYDEHTVFTYNFTKSLSLTEDRTIKYTFQTQQILVDAITLCNDPNVIKSILKAENSFESRLDFMDNSATDHVSKAFLEVVAELNRGRSTYNESSKKLARRVTKGIGPSGVEDLTEDEDKTLIDACELASKMHPKLLGRKIVIAESLSENADSTYHNGIIYIARHAVTQGHRYIAGLIFREALMSDKDITSDSQLCSYLINRLILDIERPLRMVG